MKVLVATEKPFSQDAVDGIRQIVEQAGHRFAELSKYKGQQPLVEAVADAEALIIRSDMVTAEVIAAAPKLKIVVRAGAGYDNVDLKAATERGVVVMNTPGQNANAVAELALAMMVFQARDHFSGKTGSELLGKTLGIHAFGNVGRQVARVAKGFGMKVFAFDPFVKHEAILAEGVRPVESQEELYRSCQYVSLHIPATAQTRNAINRDLLSLMPLGATLVNTARQEVIDEDGMLQLMAERPDFQYVSDIAPVKAAEFQSRFPGRFFFTPVKLGAQTAEANSNAGLAAARQIVRFFQNGETTFQVNR